MQKIVLWYTNNNFCSGHKSTKKVHTNRFIFHLICEKTLCIFLYEKHVINKPINWENCLNALWVGNLVKWKIMLRVYSLKTIFPSGYFMFLIHWKKRALLVIEIGYLILFICCWFSLMNNLFHLYMKTNCPLFIEIHFQEHFSEHYFV